MINNIEAIVLNVNPFQDSHQIATLFTSDMGLCRVIGSYSRSPKNALFGILTPLNHIEVSFRPSRSDLLKIESASLLNAHLKIRKNYDRLQLSCKMLSLIAKTQFPHNSAPLLFTLLATYLNLMQEAKSPEAILASFQLKTVRHEGIISITNACPICGNEPLEIGIEEGRTLCKTHSPSHSFTEEETAYFYALALSTSMKFLKEIEIPESLPPKVENLLTFYLD